jgi:ABC-type phosphate transport system substrate-binding protein
MRVASSVLLCALLGASSAAAQEQEFALVASTSNPLKSVKRQDLAKLFLKKTTRWSDGRDAVPVDQSARSVVRTAFTKAVLSAEGMSKTSAVESYWLQQVYSGRGNPPPVKASDGEVIAFVAANPGALGYVSAKADVSSVKILTIEQ